MPASLEDFKRAFAVTLSDDLFTRRDEQAVAALKTLNKTVGEIKERCSDLRPDVLH